MEHGAELLELCEALVGGDAGAITKTSTNVIKSMGSEALVDAVGVYSNFERMVRIADATGVELGETLAELSADIRSELRVKRPANW